MWRLQTDAGDATSIRAFDDDMIIVNLSVWEPLETLRAFVYASAHKSYLGRKAEWFEPAGEAHLAVWWIPSGTFPTVQEAIDRLHASVRMARPEGAFTLTTAFPEPSSADAG